MIEPGAEEGGEDIFAMPARCVKSGCDGEIKPHGGFMVCTICRSSYGPVATESLFKLDPIDPPRPTVPHACTHTDPLCPCQDGDACHYEGDDPMTPPVWAFFRGEGDRMPILAHESEIMWIESISADFGVEPQVVHVTIRPVE